MTTLKQYIILYGPDIDITGLTCITNMRTECKIDHLVSGDIYACHAKGDRGDLFFQRSINEMMEWEVIE